MRGGDGEAAPWDTTRRRLIDTGGQDPDDRGPGLAPGRDRPGPTRYDPRPLQRDLGQHMEERGWASMLAVAGISARWAQIVGPQVAEHARIEHFEPGLLVIRASSNSWAQQIRLVKPTLDQAISQALPPGEGMIELKILGPDGHAHRSMRKNR